MFTRCKRERLCTNSLRQGCWKEYYGIQTRCVPFAKNCWDCLCNSLLSLKRRPVVTVHFSISQWQKHLRMQFDVRYCRCQCHSILDFKHFIVLWWIFFSCCTPFRIDRRSRWCHRADSLSSSLQFKYHSWARVWLERPLLEARTRGQ